MSTVGDIMSTLWNVQYTGGKHKHTGGKALVPWGDIIINVGGRSLETQLNVYGNPSVLNIPWCTHDTPHSHHDIPTVYS